VAAALDQEAALIARERIATPASGGIGFLPDLLRNGVACLALAIGFAALAFRPGQSVSLLDEWRDLWFRTRQGRARRRYKRPMMQAEVEYFENLSRNEPGAVAPPSD
jgi:hypothetical protein